MQAVINKQPAHITDLEAEGTAEKENSSSLNRSYENAKSEINSLRNANDALTKAVALNEQTIALLQGDLTKERASRKKWQKRTFQAVGTLAAIVFTKIL